jgi:chromosome segregation ATPase
VQPRSNITTFHSVGRVAELQATVKDLEDQLQQQEEEANTAITQWQDNCATSDERCSQLDKELELLATEKDSLSKALDTVEQDNAQLEETRQVLEEKSTSLGAGLSEEPAKVLEGETSSEYIEQQLRETEKELREAKESLTRDEDIVHEWEGMFVLSFLDTYCICTSGI